MTLKPTLLAASCLSSALMLIGCPTRIPTTDTSESVFFVSIAHEHRMSGYRPTGWGWQPGSRVEIAVQDEPTASGGVSGVIKTLFTVTVTADSTFGFNSGPGFYPVQRISCGHPDHQTVTFLARNLDTGRTRRLNVPADLYFTFNPCT